MSDVAVLIQGRIVQAADVASIAAAAGPDLAAATTLLIKESGGGRGRGPRRGALRAARGPAELGTR
jgi:hypothetical protein